MDSGKFGIFAVFVIILLLLIALWYMGFLNPVKVGTPPKKVCVKWDVNDTRCVNSSEVGDKVKSGFGMIKWE